MNKLWLKTSIFLLFLALSAAFIIFFKFFSASETHSPPPSLTTRLTTHFPQLSPKVTALVAVGDIMLGRYCNVQMLNNQNFKYPFLKTADLTSSAAISFGNLESPLVENCPTTTTGMTFCTRPEAIEGLKFAGFDVLSLANNHILNYGQDGREQTTKLLNSNNILPSDPNNIAMPILSKVKGKQFNNISFGFLSFDLVTYPKTDVVEKVREATTKVDILIVSLHWGEEYQKEPAPWQKDLAHQIIDSGVKVIIGHHPHVTQPMETYHNGLIFYSLGNFVFDQPWSEETKKGEIAKIIFEGTNIKSSELIPIYIQDFCQPVIGISL